MNGGSGRGELEAAVLPQVEEALAKLDNMRQEEGRGIARELRERMAHLKQAALESSATTRASRLVEKVQARMQELIGPHADQDRVLQEAALLAERSDIQEEIVRLPTHVEHFLGMLDSRAKSARSSISCCRR